MGKIYILITFCFASSQSCTICKHTSSNYKDYSLLNSKSFWSTRWTTLNRIYDGLSGFGNKVVFGVSIFALCASCHNRWFRESRGSVMVIFTLGLTSLNDLGRVRNVFSAVGFLALATRLLALHCLWCLRLSCSAWSCSTVKWSLKFSLNLNETITTMKEKTG